MNNKDLVVFAIAGIAAVPIWWAMDRTPPYIRESGVLVAAPSDTFCGTIDMQSANEDMNIYPGSCVGVDWKIKTIRTCLPDTTHNIHPQITDSTGLRANIAPARGKFGTPDRAVDDTAIYRYFRLPVSLASGPATYESDVTYACNPLHYMWPVHVTEPKIPFTISTRPLLPPT